MTAEFAFDYRGPTLKLRDRVLLPLVQGGMGVGVSAHRLAGAVARAGAMGTIAAVDLRHHHPDLMAECAKKRDSALFDRMNLVALDREIKGALREAQGRGVVAVNVMKALSEHAALVRQACESGAQAIVMGAGLPLDLPEMAAGFPDVALVPILSDARGTTLVVKRWMRKGKLPDAIVIEHPRYAGGHLGAAKVEDLGDARFEFDVVIEDILKAFRELGVEAGRIPLIAAGGVNKPEDIRRLLSLGYSGVQMGTAFAVTEEGDAHPVFKKVLAEAQAADIVEFTSVAGLPARAVRTPWLDRYLKREKALQLKTEQGGSRRCSAGLECLTACGLRDGLSKFGQFCIDAQLAAALKGDLARGLFFRGAAPVPFGAQIRPVRDLLMHMLSALAPVVTAAPAPLPAPAPV